MYEAEVYEMDFNAVEIYEKKYTLEELYGMYLDGRLHFANRAVAEKKNDKKVLADLLDAIWMGMPVPDVYISEMQNGDFLALESDGKLKLLISFLDGKICADIYYEQTVINDGDIYGLHDRRYVARLYGTQIELRVIDYRTPLYLHMQIGKLAGSWSVTMEQSVRETIYDKEKIHILSDVSYRTWQMIYEGKKRLITATDRYRTLYMLMIWFVYRNRWHRETNVREQQLLEETITNMSNSDHEITVFLKEVEQYLQGFYPYARQSLFDCEGLKNIDNKFWGLFLCALDMSQYKGEFEMAITLLKSRLWSRVVQILKDSPFSKADIEWALNELSRSIKNDQYN